MVYRRFLHGLAILALALMSSAGPGRAQNVPAPAPAEATPAGERRELDLVAGRGFLVRLPQPAATVLSADPNIARAEPTSPTSLFITGVGPGQTTVIATNQSGASIVQFDITVAPGKSTATPPPVTPPVVTAAPVAPAGPPPLVTPAMASAIQAAVRASVENGQRIQVHSTGNGVVLSGTASGPFAAQQAVSIARSFMGDKGNVVNSLLVDGSLQVNVRVRIAEINRQVTRQLGFNWQALGSGTNWKFGLLTGAAASGAVSALSPLGLTPLNGASSTPFQLGAGFSSSKWDVNGVIDALAADQLATILAEPNLTAMSGETASFLAGGEFPIPVAGNSNNGVTQITVVFKQYGVSLALVPTVLSPGRLNLRVRPEVSQLSTNGSVSLPIAGGTLTIPALTVRRAETTVELGSGQSFAIAGLLERLTVDATNALPGLGELPVLGSLFKSNNFQRGDTELVIIVTPYIVKPTATTSALQTPLDNFHNATDLDRILFGRQIARPAGQPPLEAGFVLK